MGFLNCTPVWLTSEPTEGRLGGEGRETGQKVACTFLNEKPQPTAAAQVCEDWLRQC